MEDHKIRRRAFLTHSVCCISAATLGCRDRDIAGSHSAGAENGEQNAVPNDRAAAGSPDPSNSAPIDLHAIRNENLNWLESRGFRVADNLPLWTKTTLRPAKEIAVRLMALDAVYSWAYAIEEKASTDRLRAYADRNGLMDAMTGEDLEVFQMARGNARREFGDTVGWCLENMWPLAWIVGFISEPPLSDDFIPDSIANSLIMGFMPKLDATVDDFLDRIRLRATSAVVALHDLYYCGHNAVRNAQLGRNTVPAAFDVSVAGRVIQERRHALTWSLSPGIEWDASDLST